MKIITKVLVDDMTYTIKNLREFQITSIGVKNPCRSLKIRLLQYETAVISKVFRLKISTVIFHLLKH